MAQAPGSDAVREILTTLRTNSRGDIVSCANCHKPGSADGTDLFDDILDLSDLKKKGLIKPGDPAASRLYQALVREGRRYMPLGAERLSPRELQTIRDWIAAGATVTGENQPSHPAVPVFVTEEEVAKWVREDRERLAPEKRATTRYFSSVHLQNAGLEKELGANRLALTKVVNSLSWEKEIVQPEPVDPAGLLLRLDISKLGWTERDWDAVASLSPYQLGDHLPVVRTDWFVYATSRPPLYFTLLKLPESEAKLEDKLKINTKQNVESLAVARIGVTLSEVAVGKNRVLERHENKDGLVYWKSYDFATNSGTQNILEHPLDFARSGGEIIFSLPNGLQGYFIVNSNGLRLDEAPLGIVQDPARRHGGFTVMTGISCMRCHSNGMRRRVDEVRTHVDDNPGFEKTELDQIHRLYALPSASERLFKKDENRFMDALKKFGAENAAEPISILAKRFEDPLPLELAAAEVGVTPEVLRAALKKDTVLAREFGVLANGGTVDRQRFLSEFQLIRLHVAMPTAVPAANWGKTLFHWSASARNTLFSPAPKFSGKAPGLNQIYFVGSMPSLPPAVLRDSTIVLRSGTEGTRLTWLKNGAEKSHLDLEDSVSGLTPTADDTVVVTTAAGVVYWVKDGQKLASVSLGEKMLTHAGLLYDGTVVVGGQEGTVFWLQPGKELHRYKLDHESFGSLSILGDDVVFIGDVDSTYWLRDGKLLKRAPIDTRQSAVLPDGTALSVGDDLHWLNAKGEVAHELKLNKRILLQDPLVLADGTVFFTVLGGNGLYWAKDGVLTFTNPLQRAHERGGAAFADGTVVISSHDGYVYYFKDGKKLYEVGLGEVMEFEPVILPDGGVVVGCHDNHIYWIR